MISILLITFFHQILSQQVCNVLNFGAKGDGITLDTLAIQNALDTCGKPNTTILFPSNYIFLSFPIHISSNSTTISISKNSTLKVSDDMVNWPNGTDFLTSNKFTFISLIGQGLIDGQGQKWWNAYDQNSSVFRPQLVSFKNCNNCFLQGITFLNSPNHNIQIGGNNIEIDGITVLAPGVGHYNTDGIDISGNGPIYVHNTYISTGDDNVAIHSNNTLIENSYFGTGHGASIGSSSFSGELTNVTVRNITFNGTIQALRIKCPAGATGWFHNLTYSNLTILNVKWAICVTMFYENAPAFAECVQGTTVADTFMLWEDLHFRDIYIRNATESIGILNCQPSAPCKNIDLTNIMYDDKIIPLPKTPWLCQNAYGTQTNVQPPSCITTV